MLFLVNGLVEFTAYMDDETTETHYTRLVDAADEGDAEYKFEQNWTKLNNNSLDRYYVLSIEVSAVIV